MIKELWMMNSKLVLVIMDIPNKVLVFAVTIHVTPVMEQISITVFHVLVQLITELILLIVDNVNAWRKDIMIMV